MISTKKRISNRRYASSPKGREAHRRAVRKHSWRTSGILLTEQQYQFLLKSQGETCAVCGTPPQDKWLAVDHDHVTKKVRGLLCLKCNVAIGMADESAHILRKLADYLESANEEITEYGNR